MTFSYHEILPCKSNLILCYACLPRGPFCITLCGKSVQNVNVWSRSVFVCGSVCVTTYNVLYCLFNKLINIFLSFYSNHSLWKEVHCSKLNQSCVSSHRVPTFLCKQTWPHFWQTLGEQTQTSLYLAGQRFSPLHVWQQHGTKTKGKKKQHSTYDVHI